MATAVKFYKLKFRYEYVLRQIYTDKDCHKYFMDKCLDNSRSSFWKII